MDSLTLSQKEIELNHCYNYLTNYFSIYSRPQYLAQCQASNYLANTS